MDTDWVNALVRDVSSQEALDIYPSGIGGVFPAARAKGARMTTRDAIVATVLAMVTAALVAFGIYANSCENKAPCVCPSGARGVQVCGQPAYDRSIRPYMRGHCLCIMDELRQQMAPR
jgi:hypothetical protein